MASLDAGVSNDRSVLAVMRADDGPDGCQVVLDLIDGWQGTPTDLGDVRNMLIRRRPQRHESDLRAPQAHRKASHPGWAISLEVVALRPGRCSLSRAD
jgi:hypothetical protein